MIDYRKWFDTILTIKSTILGSVRGREH